MAALMLMLPLPQTPPTAYESVSLERIADGLQRPPLHVPPLPVDTPVFRAEVRDRPPTALEAALADIRANPTGQPPPPRIFGVGTPLIEVDVLPAIAGSIRQVRQWQRARLEREAHVKVTTELAAFCAVRDCRTAEAAAPLEGLLLPAVP